MCQCAEDFVRARARVCVGANGAERENAPFDRLKTQFTTAEKERETTTTNPDLCVYTLGTEP